MEVINLAQTRTTLNSAVQAPERTITSVSGGAGQLSNTAGASVDTLSITSSQLIITQQVEIALEIKSPRIYAPHNNNDSAEDQANQLVNKVLQKIQDEKSSLTKGLPDKERHAEAVKSVRIKVAMGFESATLALTSSGMMTNSVADNVEQTQSLVDAAINQVASQSPNEPVATNVETAAINMVSAQRALETSLQLTTREGDVVTVNFNRTQAMTAGSIEGPDGSLVYARSASSSMVAFSVQGELSEKESKSIMQVIDRINKLAEKLFNGNTGAAMGKLGALKIDTEQLASMSLNMSSSISYQAVSVYAQVSRLPDESAQVIPNSTQSVAIAPSDLTTVSNNTETNQPAIEPAGSIAAQVANEAADVVSKTVASDVFENPFDEIRNLFAQFAHMFSFGQSSITDAHKDFVNELFKDIVDKLEGSHDDREEDVTVNDMAA